MDKTAMQDLQRGLFVALENLSEVEKAAKQIREDLTAVKEEVEEMEKSNEGA